MLVALRSNVQSYTEHAPQRNDDATGQKCPLSHMTETEGGTLALQLEKAGSKGGLFDTGNMYISFECSVGEGFNSFLMMVGIGRLCPFFLLQCRFLVYPEAVM